jgi:hypothetical protein
MWARCEEAALGNEMNVRRAKCKQIILSQHAIGEPFQEARGASSLTVFPVFGLPMESHSFE